MAGKIDKKAMFDAAAEYALKDDWTCVKGPNGTDGKTPGLRYGASMPIQPQVVVLPCPCAGGEWQEPFANDEAVIGPDGLMSRPAAAITMAMQPPLLGDSATDPDDVTTQTNMSMTNPTMAEQPSSFGLIGGQLRSMVGLGAKYYPATEPYAADYGCADGFKRSPISKEMSPGKHWWDAPRIGTVVVATPCPCALGAWTGLLKRPKGGGGKPGAAAAPGFSGPAVPKWQQESSMMMDGLGGFAANLVALAPALPVCPHHPRGSRTTPTRLATFL